MTAITRTRRLIPRATLPALAPVTPPRVRSVRLGRHTLALVSEPAQPRAALPLRSLLYLAVVTLCSSCAYAACIEIVGWR